MQHGTKGLKVNNAKLKAAII